MSDQTTNGNVLLACATSAQSDSQESVLWRCHFRFCGAVMPSLDTMQAHISAVHLNYLPFLCGFVDCLENAHPSAAALLDHLNETHQLKTSCIKSSRHETCLQQNMLKLTAVRCPNTNTTININGTVPPPNAPSINHNQSAHNMHVDTTQTDDSPNTTSSASPPKDPVTKTDKNNKTKTTAAKAKSRSKTSKSSSSSSSSSSESDSKSAKAKTAKSSSSSSSSSDEDSDCKAKTKKTVTKANTKASPVKTVAAKKPKSSSSSSSSSSDEAPPAKRPAIEKHNSTAVSGTKSPMPSTPPVNKNRNRTVSASGNETNTAASVCRIFVGFLNEADSDHSLKTLAGKDCIAIDRPKPSFAFFTYPNERTAALSLDRLSNSQRQLNVGFENERTNDKAKTRAPARVSSVSVRVENLPQNTSPSDLVSLFPAANAHKMRIVRPPMGPCFSVLEFESIQDARIAMKDNRSTLLYGKRIHLQMID